MRDDFVGYTNIAGDTIGEHIADTIIEKVELMDLNPSNIRAQAYDGIGKSKIIFFNDSDNGNSNCVTVIFSY